MLEQIHAVSKDYATTLAGTIELRAIHPDDQPALRRWFDTVSEESRYARFHSYTSELSAKQWAYLTAVDGRDHVAYLAWRGDQIAGVGRWIRFDGDPELAEVAFLVGDDAQRTGIGTLLCAQLIEAARANGIRRFRAYVLPYNRGIRRLLASPELDCLRDNGTLIEVRIRDAGLASAR